MSRELSSWSRLAVILFPVVFLASCDSARHDAEYWELERETIELTHRLKLAEYRLGGGRTGDAGDPALIRNKLPELERVKQDLLSARYDLTAQINNLEYQIGGIASEDIRKRRQDAVGSKFETLTLVDGRVFKNVKVSAVEDGGVAIRHDDGAARLGFEDLTPAQRDSFGLDEASAVAARERESREALAYERQLDGELEVLRGKQELAAAEQRRRDDDRASRELMARNTTEPRVSALAKPASSFGGRSWSSRSYYRSYRPTYRYVYGYSAAPNPFCGSNYRPSSCTSIAPLPRVPGRVTFPTPTSN
jgi:hypothetical protein